MGYTFSDIVLCIIVFCGALFAVHAQLTKQQRLREALLTSLVISLKDVSVRAYRTDTPNYVPHVLEAIDSALAVLESLNDNGPLGDSLLSHTQQRLAHYSSALKTINPGTIQGTPEGKRVVALIGGLRSSIQKWLGEPFEDKVLGRQVVLRKRLPKSAVEARAGGQ